jgi:hypothetical protein
MDIVPETAARFVVVVQGVKPWAGLAEGIDGVKETLLRVLWSDPKGALLGEVAAVIASLEDPAVWAAHGAGDGDPYWHWWFGYEGGSVTVQRLTEAAPHRTDSARLRAALAEAIGPLADCAQDLRRLAGQGEDGYVFGARLPATGPS